MSTVAAPYGLIPNFHPSGVIRPSVLSRGIVSGLAQNLFKHAPVFLAADGTLNVFSTPGAGEILGSFAGVEFTDAFGRRQHSPAWVSGTVATNIVAYVWDDADILYRIQGDAGIAVTGRGEFGNFVNPTAGNATTLYSTAALDVPLAGATGDLLVVDKYERIDNDWFDVDPVSGAFTDVIVKIARPQLAANF